MNQAPPGCAIPDSGAVPRLGRPGAEGRRRGTGSALWLLLAGLLSLLLQGCALSPLKVSQARQQLALSAAQPSPCEQQSDHCAHPSALLDLARQALQRSRPDAPVNAVTLLDRGDDALASRLNLIAAARHSIDVQTFIWSEDDVGNLMLDALIQAARRGVQVRILADQLFSFNDPLLLDKLARADPHLQVRLYNPTFQQARTSPLEFAAGIACCFAHFNQRMHNKVMIVDDVAGITGGRNYEDRYFDLDPDFDYVDRDVLVGGPVAQSMTDSFQQFWNHRRSVSVVALRDVNAQILRDRPPYPAWRTPSYRQPQIIAAIRAQAEDPAWIQGHLVGASLLTGKVSFLSDLPSKTDDPARRHALAYTQRVMQMISQAHFEVILQTPYLVMSRRSRKVFSHLHAEEDPPRVVISTNSLASTDAFAVYAASYKHRYRYLDKFGFEIYEMKPQHPVTGGESMARDLGLLPDTSSYQTSRHPNRNVRSEHAGLLGLYRRHLEVPLRDHDAAVEAQRFGLHAKSMVIDDHLVMIGSHNLDPRSDHYNTEAGVIIDDARLANAVRESILDQTQPDNAWVIAPRPWSTPVLGAINRQLSIASESLPTLDLWPYRYATSYQIKPGCTPLRPDSPRFRDCYVPAGDFPDVALSAKLILTRLITAFAAELNGVL
ncbi:phospholipase D-like domain-containing protein [Frateuria aurantia]